MYIGPWQEFKLAKVLQAKQNYYEGPKRPYRLNAANLE
jgi:hypothetical protein